MDAENSRDGPSWPPYTPEVPNPQLGVVAPLQSDIDVLAGTDVDALWESFRFYEAGHHRMTIMNPLSSTDLDRLIAELDLAPGDRVLDIGCGHGELLARIAPSVEPDRDTDAPPWLGDRPQIVGVDLSPWTVRRARARLAEPGPPGDRVQLVLGDGRAFVDQHPDDRWDVIALIGAPWIWDGFAGSVETLAPLLRPGGRLVVADVVVPTPEVRIRLDAEYGAPLTTEEQRTALLDAGLTELVIIPTTAAEWRAYDDRVLDGIEHWLRVFPGDTEYLARHQRYEDARATGADVGWQVWIAVAGELDR